MSGMGVDLDNSDKECASGTDEQASPVDSPALGATRRRFARNAVIGSAVVFSLGNRAAWGVDTGVPDACLSQMTWGSYIPGADGGFFASMPPTGTPEYEDKLDKLTKADAIATAGADESTYPGYVCPKPQASSVEPDEGNKLMSTVEKLTGRKAKKKNP